MKTWARAIAAGILMISACNRAAPSNSPEPVDVEGRKPPVPPPATGPDAKTPLGKPEMAIDPKSMEAARQVVVRFASLLDQRRFAEAQKLFENQLVGAGFIRGSKYLSKQHFSNIGRPHDEQGAAGSTYVTVDTVLWTKDAKTGIGDHHSVPIILRRANDVPGASAEERRWRIHDVMMPPSP